MTNNYWLSVLLASLGGMATSLLIVFAAWLHANSNTPRRRRRRWAGNDSHLGPFTYGRSDGYNYFDIILSSGDEGGNPGCHLRFTLFGLYLFVELPQLIQPWHREWECHAREYGFSMGLDHLHVFLGPHTFDSSTTKDWYYSFPWMQWRHVRFSLYGLEGEHFWTQLESERPRGFGFFDEQHKMTEACPRYTFMVFDYDLELIEARTHIEEREWRAGDRWCKWLSWFRKPRIHRTLAIKFSKEVGPEKGSWKGGTVGSSIGMIPGELHESAFRRYCLANNLKFIDCEE